MRRKKIARFSRELRYALKSIPTYHGNAFIDAIRGVKDKRFLINLFRNIPGVYLRSEYLQTDISTLEFISVYFEGKKIYEFVY